MRARLEAWRVLSLLMALAVVAAAVLAVNAGAQVAISEWGVPTPNSQPGNLAIDSAGNAWFTEIAGNRITRISQTGVFQEFEVPTPNSQPWGIALDAGGRIWFTEAAGNKIGNVTANGTFGQDNIPTADSQPRGLALDASGNLWFAESNANKIGRLSASGSAFAEFDVPTSASQPWGVAVDASGNVWFTERAANKIGRMTPGGQFTEFQIPTAGSGPTGIVVDASGNVWFAEFDANKIGMMTPTGSFTEFQIPTANSKPTWIALDRAGAVWFAGSNSNSFGRVAGGTVLEYGLPSANSGPFGIAVDGSGNVWLTEQTANRIARATGIAPQATPTATPAPLTPTPVPATATPAPVPQPPVVPHDSRYFVLTGFRVDNDTFWDYFNARGGINTFGYPVSRTFTFLGFTTQFFQRGIMQIGPNGAARTMNMLDPGLMPYTQINGSTFPAPDPTLANSAPAPGTPDYDVRVQEFVRNNAPDQFQGLRVNFYQAFVNTVKLQDAFPLGGGNEGLLPLLNLEVWGVPTSRPAYDPNNQGFVYLRFQRGIMHFDVSNGATQGLLLADYLKSIITGQSLPPDLDAQARGSQFYKQYNPTRPNWVDRPDQLPATDLAFAFERG